MFISIVVETLKFLYYIKIFLYIHIPRCIGIGRTGDGVLKHRTPSKRLILERARCVEFCHISSGWFKHIEPHRTPSKHMILEIARCVEFCHGSRGLNHSETVYRYPTQLVTVKMRFEKVRYSRTTPNSRQRLLHTLLSLH